MTFWQRWVRQPQTVWVRKAIFQVHLWSGIGAGLYIFVVCVSGSALVFRPELSRAFSRGPVIVESSGTLLSDEQLKEAALRAYPGYQVSRLYKEKAPNAAVEVWLDTKGDRKLRLFDPFTGVDLGPSVPFGSRTLAWVLDLHDNLLGGPTGRLVNGAGGLVLLLLCLTGAVVWWPGIKIWRRRLMLHRGVNWKRFTFDFHSALGFWTFAFIFMWAFTGFYIVYQEWFTPLVDYIFPQDEVTFEPRAIDEVLVWLPRVHFGRFRQLPAQAALAAKVLWVIIGIAPAVLFVTGGLMWWSRVVRRGVRQSVPDAGLVQATSSIR
jgi:uncharacterized iron-regulated membrane protein